MSFANVGQCSLELPENDWKVIVNELLPLLSIKVTVTWNNDGLTGMLLHIYPKKKITQSVVPMGTRA